MKMFKIPHDVEFYEFTESRSDFLPNTATADF